MFSKQTEYAIRGLVYILMENKNGRRPGFKEIAREIDSPEQYLAKILQVLTKQELIRSVKGRGGGFFFAHPHQPLPLFDVIKITEGEKFFTNCVIGLQSCNAKNPCPLHHNYVPVREELLGIFTKESVQSLAEKIINKEAVLSRLIFKNE